MNPLMKSLLISGLLSLGATGLANAQTDAAQTAKQDAEDAQIRAQLDKARAELDRKAQEVAELSTKLGGGNDVFFRTGGPRRAMLGVQIDPESGKDGARVRSVSPGGPADEAGLKAGDRIIALDGTAISGSEDSGRVLVDQMRDVKPDQKVKVRVVRDGKNKDLVVVARPMGGMTDGPRMIEMHGPGMAAMPRGVGPGPMPFVQQFRFHHEFNGLELASLTPKLGAYFGTSEGVLVVSAPKDESLKLEDGDVIRSIDGRKPTDGAHALRILRSYKSGEKLALGVLRQRKAMTLAVTMPERREGGDEDLFFSTLAPPPAPDAPPMPPPPPGHGD